MTGVAAVGWRLEQARAKVVGQPSPLPGFSMRLRTLAIALATACLTTLAGAGEPGSGVKLPDIGSSAAALATPQELREYGAGMLAEMRAHEMVLDDPLLADYINALGYRLVAASQRPDSGFTFFIMRDQDINAFAAPGGYVAVNAGLINAMSSEDELAGVLAHEISHVQQLHILRAFEDQKKMSIPIMLAMVGVMIAAAGRTDDAAPAALVAGQSLMIQRQINFTRGDEAEADRVGIQTLARAGFDPNAMAGAFQELQKVMRVNGIDIPEFLLDHPVDTKRIAEAKERARQLGCPQTAHALRPAPARTQGGLKLDLNLASAPPADIAATTSTEAEAGVETTTRVAAHGEGKALPEVTVTACAPHDPAAQHYFLLMRERARVLSAPVTSTVRDYYARNLRDDPEFATAANRYGYALALTRTQRASQAVDELRRLVAAEPDSLPLQLALADALNQTGAGSESFALYQRLHVSFPGNRAITLAYADALLGRADADSARKALDLLRPLLARNADDAELQRAFARANQLAGDKVRAAEAFAEAAWLTGHAEDALNQLKALAKRDDLSYYERSRVEARIARLTPEVLALRKRNSPSEPDDKDSKFACCRPSAF